MSESRPTLDHKPKSRKAEVKQDELLERGIVYTEPDGTRLIVTIGDVRGSDEAKLHAACGKGFMDLLEALSVEQRSDLLAAVVWFCRLVNDRDNVGTYEDTLDEIGFADFDRIDDPDKSAVMRPKA